MNAALAFAEEFAPERLELVGPSAEASRRVSGRRLRSSSGRGRHRVRRLRAGWNHCLPTGGAARFASGVSRGTSAGA